jgi:pyrroloquinoline quinone biosynthesis protein B
MLVDVFRVINGRPLDLLPCGRFVEMMGAMRIILLGTAAGGGLPQWNCNCSNCREARAGSTRVTPRTQSSVAVSADGRAWFLMNASPDLRVQLERVPDPQRRNKTLRGTNIEAVLLTNADLDHTLGLLLMREGGKVRVHATPRIREALTRGISLAPTLQSFGGIHWTNPSRKLSPLLRRDGSRSGLRYQVIDVIGTSPRYMKGSRSSGFGHSVGYRIVDEKSGRRLLYLPDVAVLDEQTIDALSDCDVLLFDGTFWSENEMRKLGVGNLSAKQMGHIPIGGRQGSLKQLAPLRTARKIYTHINNTNPILRKGSPEYDAIRAVGVEVGRDGMELVI